MFYLKDPLSVSMDSKVHGVITMVRQEKNKRLYNLKVQSSVDDGEEVCAIYEIP